MLPGHKIELVYTSRVEKHALLARIRVYRVRAERAYRAVRIDGPDQLGMMPARIPALHDCNGAGGGIGTEMPMGPGMQRYRTRAA